MICHVQNYLPWEKDQTIKLVFKHKAISYSIMGIVEVNLVSNQGSMQKMVAFCCTTSSLKQSRIAVSVHSTYWQPEWRLQKGSFLVFIKGDQSCACQQWGNICSPESSIYPEESNQHPKEILKVLLEISNLWSNKVHINRWMGKENVYIHNEVLFSHKEVISFTEKGSNWKWLKLS